MFFCKHESCATISRVFCSGWATFLYHLAYECGARITNTYCKINNSDHRSVFGAVVRLARFPCLPGVYATANMGPKWIPWVNVKKSQSPGNNTHGIRIFFSCGDLLLISVGVEGNADLLKVTPLHFLITVTQMNVIMSFQK